MDISQLDYYELLQAEKQVRKEIRKQKAIFKETGSTSAHHACVAAITHLEQISRALLRREREHLACCTIQACLHNMGYTDHIMHYHGGQTYAIIGAPGIESYSFIIPCNNP